MGKTNRLWHEQNKMPLNPTPQQRIDWHLAHSEHCACRPIPDGVVVLMEERGIPLPARDGAARLAGADVARR